MALPDGLQIKIRRQGLGCLANRSREMAGGVVEEVYGISVEGKTIVVLVSC
ncbi:MAG: hypothetical protein RL572_1378 [Pseudomonadota bacterium]|jgi:hypothetical protein